MPEPEANLIECVALRQILAEKDGKPQTFYPGETLSLPEHEVERYIFRGIVQSPDAPLPEGLRSPSLPPAEDEADTPPDPSTPSDSDPSRPKVNVNSATLPELLALPGIKATQAKTIVENRPYTTIEQVVEKLELEGRSITKWNAEVVPLIEV